MKLTTLDIGNSRIKVFDHQRDQLINVGEINSEHSIIFSSVLNKEERGHKYPTLDFNSFISVQSFIKGSNFLSMHVDYTINSIGRDRLLTAYIASKRNETSLIVDAGTFCTFDYVSKNTFEGGYIAHGLRLLIETYKQGSLLPHLNILDLENLPPYSSLPKSTSEAMLQSIHSYYRSFLTSRRVDKIILTGGDAKVLSSLFEQDVILKPHLIHLAMKEAFIDSKSV